jgi:hypothetical protein
MGHSIRISDSYYRATAPELPEDYLKAVPSLSVSIETEILLKQLDDLEKSRAKDESFSERQNQDMRMDGL